MVIPGPLTGVRRRSSLETYVHRPHKPTCFLCNSSPGFTSYKWRTLARNLCPSVCLFVSLSVLCCAVYPCLSVCTGHSVCNMHAFIHWCTNGYEWITIVNVAATRHQNMSRLQAESRHIAMRSYDRSRRNHTRTSLANSHTLRGSQGLLVPLANVLVDLRGAVPSIL